MKTRFIYSKAIGTSKKERTVLLIHGLESFRYTLSYLALRFRRAGWNVLQFRYPCHKLSLYTVAEILPEKLKELPHDQRPDVAVGYSMGGVILSEVLRETPMFPRVVLLGSPLLYSQMSAILMNWPIAPSIFGPALLDLAKPREPKIHDEVAVATIAGYGPLWGKTNPILSGPNDGLVQVREAKLDGVSSHHTIYSTHPELVLRKRPFTLTKDFLQIDI